MEQQTGPELGKEYVKAVYCHPAYLTYLLIYLLIYLTYLQNAGLDDSCAGIRIARKNINNLRYTDAESEEELKNFLMKVKEE